MSINIFRFIAAMSIGSLLLVSCSDDKENNTSHLGFTNVYNLASGPKFGDNVEVSKCNYLVGYNMLTSKMEVKSSDFLFNNNVTSFEFPSSSFSEHFVRCYHLFGAASGSVKIGGEVVGAADCLIKELYNYSLPFVPGISSGSQNLSSLLMDIELLDNQGEIATFTDDTYFRGTFSSKYYERRSYETYQENGKGVRLIMDVEKRKAKLVMYDVKLYASMPESILVFDDLDLNFGYEYVGYYSITGNNVTAKVVESSSLKDLDGCVFTSIELLSGGNLRRINITFKADFKDKVIEYYTGQFLMNTSETI